MKTRLLILGLLLIPLKVLADEVDSFQFSKNGDKGRTYAIEKYNRLTFTDDSFILSSSTDAHESVIIPYGDYNRVVLTEGHLLGIEDVSIEGNTTLRYDHATHSVELIHEIEEEYMLRVYDTNGDLVAQGKNIVDLSSHPANVYIAIATNGQTNLIIKFIND